MLSQHSRAHELQLLSPLAPATEAWAPRGYAPQQEKPLQWEACALQLDSSPCLLQLEKDHRLQWRATTANK